ncbi:MAG: hypothetical protein SW019_07730, partial [Actinomycetota bacterium]|nr:hypothetical protein [Actinomycetota bacterium]
MGVPVTGFRARATLLAVVTAAGVLNAWAFGAEATGPQVMAVLQFGTAAGAVIYGLMVARRVGGLARRWRLLAVSALAGLCLGELAWWAGGQDRGQRQHREGEVGDDTQRRRRRLPT